MVPRERLLQGGGVFFKVGRRQEGGWVGEVFKTFAGHMFQLCEEKMKRAKQKEDEINKQKNPNQLTQRFILFWSRSWNGFHFDIVMTTSVRPFPQEQFHIVLKIRSSHDSSYWHT